MRIIVQILRDFHFSVDFFLQFLGFLMEMDVLVVQEGLEQVVEDFELLLLLLFAEDLVLQLVGLELSLPRALGLEVC